MDMYEAARQRPGGEGQEGQEGGEGAEEEEEEEFADGDDEDEEAAEARRQRRQQRQRDKTYRQAMKVWGWGRDRVGEAGPGGARARLRRHGVRVRRHSVCIHSRQAVKVRRWEGAAWRRGLAGPGGGVGRAGRRGCPECILDVPGRVLAAFKPSFTNTFRTACPAKRGP